MKTPLKIFMVLLGCTPKGRVTEQHDVFFGIGENLSQLVSQMNAFWPEAKGKLHIDAWRQITIVDNHSIEIIPKNELEEKQQHLFFLNLGGYKWNEFEEYHYKMLAVSPTLSVALKKAKKTVFYKHCGYSGNKGAVSHIDEKYGIDVDDFHKVTDLLPPESKILYQLKITALPEPNEDDELHIGYVKMKSLL